MLKIQCVGKMRSGKDTVWEILNNYLPCGVPRISYADTVKSISTEILTSAIDTVQKLYSRVSPDITLPEIPRDLLKDKSLTREFLVRFSTDIIRHYDPDFWWRITEKIHADTIAGGNFVITDCRFPNEIRDDTLIVNILATPETLWSRYCESTPNPSRKEWEKLLAHESEQLSNNIQLYVPKDRLLTITNNHSMDCFRMKLIESLKQRGLL
jgi:hypothetical protein